jgi:hypothetical protein
VYLSLGEGRHVDELRFAVLSAARFHTGDAGWSIRVYTDRPDLFADLPAEVRALSAETAAAWSGSAGYVYRGKIAALADALADPDTTRAAIVDGDTYATRSPEKLFARIAPGRTLMHQREGRPHPPEMAALRTVLAVHTPVDAAGRSWGITETETLWNSGVVGLHRADAAFCDEALSLTDQLLEHGFAERSHTAEMVAFGVVLARRSKIRECRDVITHYWPAKIRKPFLIRLREVWADRSIDQQTAFDRLWADRPRESLEDRLKTRVKRTAAGVGLELGRRS